MATQEQPKNPLHGIKLEMIVTRLVEHYGWEELAGRINIRCFASDPSVKSSLKFLRRTPWARAKVERLYLRTEKNKSIWGAAQAPDNEPEPGDGDEQDEES